jgi:hypothetical protein
MDLNFQDLVREFWHLYCKKIYAEEGRLVFLNATSNLYQSELSIISFTTCQKLWNSNPSFMGYLLLLSLGVLIPHHCNLLMSGPHPLPRDLLHADEPHGPVIPNFNRSILDNFQWNHCYLLT